ncbi:hypothetical protein FHS13_001458 [Nocardiopsis algeriensis]|uniref:Uncharacterized protein n=1 Tax=Nocardiopsis algeriensis TaxID=1478215 RepID=A0A841IL48_9ACTN|nr:hypothetical protein [Nocardiopsis algeriensis]
MDPSFIALRTRNRIAADPRVFGRTVGTPRGGAR